MIDKITKALEKLSIKERRQVKSVLEKLAAGNLTGLDVKRLKDRDDIFRVRSGDIRLIYQKKNKGQCFVLAIARRNEKTYKV